MFSPSTPFGWCRVPLQGPRALQVSGTVLKRGKCVLVKALLATGLPFLLQLANPQVP